MLESDGSSYELGVGLSVVGWGGWGRVADYLRWVCEFYGREWEVVPSFWLGVVGWSGWGSGVVRWLFEGGVGCSCVFGLCWWGLCWCLQMLEVGWRWGSRCY